jgi:ABC-type branched-subunit amino acid transport system ATPase component
MDNKDYILSLENLSKSFPGVKALDDVSFKIERGAIHALVGENGAGKSTLIKILAGIYHADKGRMILNGKQTAFRTPHDSHVAGIGVVHQEIKLAEPLSVTENMFIGNLIYKHGLVDWAEMRARAKKIIADLGIDIDVNAPVESLSVAKKQIVEICKAINLDVRLLIMDEPSATLSDRELEIMFDIVRKLKSEGITVIYISHRLDEVFKLADKVTVLRDGKHIETLPIEQVTRDKLITMMVGRELGQEYPKVKAEIGDVILDVKNLCRKGVLNDISFNVKKGEVLGISDSFGIAFYKSQEAAQLKIPDYGTVLISVNDEDKPEALEIARTFEHLGLRIVATEGTLEYLVNGGVKCARIKKLYEGRPNIMDEIMNENISFVINTPAPLSIQAQNDDSYIRKTAIRKKVCYMTTMAAAKAAAVALDEIKNNPKKQIKSLQEYHTQIR